METREISRKALAVALAVNPKEVRNMGLQIFQNGSVRATDGAVLVDYGKDIPDGESCETVCPEDTALLRREFRVKAKRGEHSMLALTNGEPNKLTFSDPLSGKSIVVSTATNAGPSADQVNKMYKKTEDSKCIVLGLSAKYLGLLADLANAAESKSVRFEIPEPSGHEHVVDAVRFETGCLRGLVMPMKV